MRLLYIEDVILWQRLVGKLFQEDAEVEFLCAGDAETARTLLDSHRPHLVLLDLNIPRSMESEDESPEHGLQLLRHIKLSNPRVPVIIVTQHSTDVPLAVEAMKLGAQDFILKRDDPSLFEETQLKVRQCHRFVSEQTRLEQDNQAQAQALEGMRHPLAVDHFGPLIGDSPAMQSLYGLVERIAKTDTTVLLLGERGTGKSLVARTIHEHSHRAGHLFYPVPMPRFESNELLLDELFGHTKGAFTGATGDREGIFEYANSGTVFLDEIGDIDLGVQAKLLQFIEDKSLKRLGDNRLREADVRLIAATNKDLEQAVNEGRFRADLYDRLNVVAITLPPLRERREDLFLLIPHFLEQYRIRYHKEQVTELSSEALQTLHTYDYPGNVRELEHAIDRGMALASGIQITCEDLPERFRVSPVPSESDLDPRQEKLLQWMRAGGVESITNRTYRELLQVGHNTAHLDLSDLVARGHLVADGAGRAVHYHLRT